ncbi:Uncharacterised protein [Mycobacteroides abscessus]|nr:Uncharacterised protein [Mycobacteroides abscessus]SHW75589.1 Uncharacterised protein [Mycobacteroides abscessus subsp. abscessus]
MGNGTTVVSPETVTSRAAVPQSAPRKLTMVWNSGFHDSERTGLTASTSFSMGSSW